MLHKNKSENKSQWKYLLLLPLLVAFVLTFNTKVIAQEKKLVDFEEVNDLTIDLVIDKNSADKHFKKEATTFKKEFDITLTFKGVKRNVDNEITAIKIEAKGKGLKAKFENAGSNPINPIKISYNADSNSLNISNLSKLHKDHYSYTIHDTDGKHLIDKHGEKGSFVFVTSDGKKKTWTSDIDKSEYIVIKEIHTDGDKSKNIELTVIGEKGDGEHRWIHKKDKKNNKTIKAIVVGDHHAKVLEKVHEIEVISEKNGENVFIIKSDEHKSNKHKISKKGDFVFMSSENENPLYILNGKEISSEEMKKLKSETIEKIEILKGKSAMDKYGEKAKDGVIQITSKKN